MGWHSLLRFGRGDRKKRDRGEEEKQGGREGGRVYLKQSM